jgi:hypothetical protein
MEPMRWAAMTQLLLQPLTTAADGGGEKVRQPISTRQPSIVSACLAARQSTATLRGEGRATNNQHQRQQERATRGNRVSGCGNITINQKISFNGGISKRGGNAAAAKMTARAARAGAMQRRQRGIMATTAARTGLCGSNGGSSEGSKGQGAVDAAAATAVRAGVTRRQQLQGQ